MAHVNTNSSWLLTGQLIIKNKTITVHKLRYSNVLFLDKLSSIVIKLQNRLAQSDASYKGMIRKQLDLEEDIDVKANTLFIDETECMGMRKSINIQAY